VDWIGNIWTSHSKIDKAPNQVTIACRVRQWNTISRTKLNIELHRSLNGAVITKSSTSKEVLYILLLGDIESIGGGRDLNPKEVAKRTKIGHEKLLMETSLNKGNILRVVTGDDHVIHIEQKKSPTTRRCVDKQR
jgi:hypothetical protein